MDLPLPVCPTRAILSPDLIFNERAPTIPHANINNWDLYISNLMDRNWDYLVPGHGKLVEKKMKLVVVDSPAKARTISRYLGSDYKVVASVGHIRDLPKKNLGLDLDNEFKTTYEVSPKSKKSSQ